LITLRGVLGRLLLLVLSVAVSLAIAEGFFLLLLSHPAMAARLPSNVLSHLRAYYLHHDRNLVQALPECARYDSRLFYTLRPGVCRFKAREFDVEIRVNSAGVRDDEESLIAPQVIVAGDSFAMGWGVAQDEAFPQRLAKQTGLKVLNAGIPSYGTAREMRLLDRLDTSRLRYLLIQYDDNDEPENETFFEQQNNLAIKPESAYVADVQRNGRRSAYFPGKVTLEILRGILYPEPLPVPAAVPPKEEARYFVNAVLHGSRADLSAVQIIVFELQPYRVAQSDFEEALIREISHPGHKPYIRRLRVLDLRGAVHDEDYFTLDDHMRPAGHAKLARLLADTMQESR
jgi:lysophospholipase L1-like esterase